MDREKQRKNEAGFTIVEIMAVVVIIGMLAAVVTVNVVGKIKRARVEKRNERFLIVLFVIA